MKIVIDIPEYVVVNDSYANYFKCMSEKLYEVLQNGTPLPDGAEILTKEAYSDLCTRAANSCTTTDSTTDCISREAAIQAVTHFDDTLKRLYELPAVNPAKVGHWIEHEWAEELDGYLISNFECDKCHAWAGDDYDYCPNCGVKMEVSK